MHTKNSTARLRARSLSCHLQMFLSAVTEARRFAARSNYKWIEEIHATHINKGGRHYLLLSSGHNCPVWKMFNRLSGQKRELARGKSEATKRGANDRQYLPQTLISPPSASRYEPGLFTFVPLLRDAPQGSHLYRVRHLIGVYCCDPSFLKMLIRCFICICQRCIWQALDVTQLLGII